MKRLIVKAKYGQDFTHVKLPKLFLKLITSELSKPINITVLTYIRDNYNINKPQLIALLKANLRVSGYADNIIIDFNNAKINEEENLYLETIIDFINDGNLQFRGSNIINNIINYLEANLDSLYRLSRVRGSSNIWQ
jgi:hypothetical protein